MIQKKFRLHKKDTEWVLRKGAQITTDLFLVRSISNSEPETKPHPQFSIVTSAKLAKKAVDRNKLKRKISEAIRLDMQENLPMKIVIIPKKRALDVEYKEIETDIKKLFSKLT